MRCTFLRHWWCSYRILPARLHTHPLANNSPQWYWYLRTNLQGWQSTVWAGLDTSSGRSSVHRWTTETKTWNCWDSCAGRPSSLRLGSGPGVGYCRMWGWPALCSTAGSAAVLSPRWTHCVGRSTAAPHCSRHILNKGKAKMTDQWGRCQGIWVTTYHSRASFMKKCTFDWTPWGNSSSAFDPS